MLDRPARTELIGAISEYLSDSITAFAFDARIREIADETKDQTLQVVVNELWFFYDDCDDHHVVLSKEEWDNVQRLMLVLDSDSQLCLCRTRHWSLHQVFAITALVCLGVLLWGFNLSYWFVAIPFGVLSMGISLIRKRYEPLPSTAENALTPFASFGEIRDALRRNSVFRKKHYPVSLALRRIRRPDVARFRTILAYILWLFASPIVLLVQAFPDLQIESHVQAA